MELTCCVCQDRTNWIDIIAWDNNDKFYCPVCHEKLFGPIIEDITVEELRKIG